MDSTHSSFRKLLFLTLMQTCFAAQKFNRLEAITFNVGLLESTPADARIPVTRLARRDSIIAALNSTDADLVCLQEVKFGEDVQAIVEGVASVYPYSFSKIHQSDGTVDGSPGQSDGPLCDGAVFLNLLVCGAQFACLSGTIDKSITCLWENCETQIAAGLTSSSEDCMSCFLSSYPDVTVFAEQCGGVKPSSTMNAPGLLLLSKSRLKKTKYVDFSPKTTDWMARGYLSAKVSGNLQVACTELSINFETYFEGNLMKRFSSFAEQSLFEAERLIKSFGGKQLALIMGTFNSGPARSEDGVRSELKETYKKLSRTFTTQLSDDCTVCASNDYNRGSRSYVMDHFFGKGVEIDRVKTILPKDETSLFIDGAQLPFSYHEAVKAIVKRIK